MSQIDMSNRTAGPRDPRGSDERAKGKSTAAPPSRRVSKPVAPKPQAKRDLFGLYFLLGATALILLFGALVFFLRSNQAAPGVAPTATPTIETVSALPTIPVEESPLPNFTPPPRPTLPWPNALSAGPYAQGEALGSQVGQADEGNLPARIPVAVPQPQLDLSPTLVAFGDVNNDQTPGATITLANPSGLELIIRAIYTDCECVEAAVEAQRLQSGERTRLVIRYHPSEDPTRGSVVHGVSIVSTDGQEPLREITLTANVRS